MDDIGSTTYLLILVLLMLSAFFSASETAFSAANMIRLRTMAEDGNKRAAQAVKVAAQYDKLIATIRSREISASIILQSQSQLKAMYKDSADTILGNCDTTLFLGGKEKTTLKEMSELLGKETIDLYNTSETRSNQKSFGMNYQKTGKQLMTEDEIAVMDGGKCILQIRGARPFFSDKYDITKHKNYRLLSDANEKNRYRVEKELNPQYTPKSEEEVEMITVNLTEEPGDGA